MSDVLEKLGIFDLLAVLLTGVSVLTVSMLVFDAVASNSLNIQLEADYVLPFFVISYICGIAFQEIGSRIEKEQFDGGIWTVFEKKMLDASATDARHEYLRDTYQYQKEKLAVKETSGEPENNDTHNNIVYDYCKRYAQDKDAMSQIDRFTSICVMSRSLSLYFCLLAYALLLLAILEFSLLKLLLIAIFGSLCILFYYRFKRFSEIRYLSVFQIFYYNNYKAIRKWKNQRNAERDPAQVSD